MRQRLIFSGWRVDRHTIAEFPGCVVIRSRVKPAGCVQRLVGNDGRRFERLAQHAFAIKLPNNIELMWLQSGD
jgi:hypothetical protein